MMNPLPEHTCLSPTIIDVHNLKNCVDRVCGTPAVWEKLQVWHSGLTPFHVSGPVGEMFIKTAQDTQGISKAASEAVRLQEWADYGAPEILGQGRGFVAMKLISGHALNMWTANDLKEAGIVLNKVAQGPTSSSLVEGAAFSQIHIDAVEHVDSQMLEAAHWFVEEIRPLVEVGCHGDPHEHNWLSTRSGLVLIDWERASGGPQGWDRARLACRLLDVDTETRLQFLLEIVDPDRARALVAAYRVKSTRSTAARKDGRPSWGFKLHEGSMQMWNALR